MNSIYENVFNLIEERGMTKSGLEKCAGIGNGTLGKWESGSVPSIKTLMKISSVLDVPVEDLIKEK